MHHHYHHHHHHQLDPYFHQLNIMLNNIYIIRLADTFGVIFTRVSE